MTPHVKNVILASADQVAIDAVAAKLMGFDPLSIKFIRLAHDAGLGCGDPRDIEIVGDEAAGSENWHFEGPFKKMTFASKMQAQDLLGAAPQAARVVIEDCARAVGLHGERPLPRHLLVPDEGPTGHAGGPRERMGSSVSGLGANRRNT